MGRWRCTPSGRRRSTSWSARARRRGPGARRRTYIAARNSHQPVEELIGRWRAELSDAGHPPSQLVADIQAAARHRDPVLDRLEDETTANLVAETLGAGSRLAEVKVFDRSDVIVAVAPRLHGLPVSELDRVVELVIAHSDCVPLIGVAGARTQNYATAGVLAAEARIAELADTLAAQPAAHVSDQGCWPCGEGRRGASRWAVDHRAAASSRSGC